MRQFVCVNKSSWISSLFTVTDNLRKLIKRVNNTSQLVWGNQSSETMSLIKRQVVYKKYWRGTIPPHMETAPLRNLLSLFFLHLIVKQKDFHKRNGIINFAQKHWNENMHDSIYQPIHLVIRSFQPLSHNFINIYPKRHIFIWLI